MSRFWWFVGGAAVVGAGLALAAHTEGGEQIVATVKRKVEKGAQRMSEALGGGIKQDQIDRIQQYHIASLIEQYRGAVPFGVACAMGEHEANFFPTIYNYYPVENGKKNTGKLGRAYAALGTPTVTVWQQPGDGGCQFDPHACGLYQILDNIRLANKPMGYGGVPLPYLNDLFDPEKNIHAALAGRDTDTRKILKIVPGASGALLAALIYMAHAEGLGKLTGGKQNGQYVVGALQKIINSGQPVTWAAIAALPWGVAGFWKLGNRLSGIASTAARASVWEAAKASLLGGTPVVGADAAPGAVPDATPPPDPAEALLMAVQAAEMERDLPLAADLRARLDLLTGSA